MNFMSKGRAPNQDLYNVSAGSIQVALGLEETPDDWYVLIAKNQVMGMERNQIAEILSTTVEAIAEVEADPQYVVIKEFVAGVHAKQRANQATGWDAAENIALSRLNDRLQTETDPEFLLKVAAVANKATRRMGEQAPHVLDPSQRSGKVQLVLTSRYVQKLSGNGKTEIREETQEVSIRDGTMANPTFAELDTLLGIKNVPILPENLEVQTRNAAELPSIESMVEDFLKF